MDNQNQSQFGPQVITPNQEGSNSGQAAYQSSSVSPTIPQTIPPQPLQTSPSDTSLQDLETPATQSLDTPQQAFAQPVTPITATPTVVAPGSNKLLRKILVVIAIVLVSLLVVAAAFYFINRSRDAQQQVAEVVPEQSIDIAASGGTELFDISTGKAANKLIINGSVVASNSVVITGASNNTYGQISAAGLTSNYTYTLPNANGTICLDSNNCNFLTGVQLAGAISDLEAGAGITIVDNTVSINQTVVTNDKGFIQGGNSFGTNAVLGTNDNYALNFETNGSSRMQITTNGALYLNSAVTAGSIPKFSVPYVSGDGIEVEVATQDGSPLNVLTYFGSSEAGNDTVAIVAESYDSAGIYATSVNSVGLASFSTNSTGLYGTTVNGSLADSEAGVLGFNYAGDGYGVLGQAGLFDSGTGIGVGAIGADGYGLYARSSGNISGLFQAKQKCPLFGGCSDSNTAPTLVSRQLGALTTDLFQVQNSSSTELMAITYDGKITFGSAADTNLYRSAADTLSTDDKLTVGTSAQINSGAAGNIGLVVQGAASQTANLQEWQDSSGTVLASIGATGAATFQNSANSSTAFRVLNAAGNRIANIDTSSGELQLGQSSTATGTLRIYRGSGGSDSSTLTMLGAQLQISSTNGGGSVLLTGQSNGVIARSSSDSTTAFRVQTSGGANILTVDAASQRVAVNTTTALSRDFQIGNDTINQQWLAFNRGATSGGTLTVHGGGHDGVVQIISGNGSGDDSRLEFTTVNTTTIQHDGGAADYTILLPDENGTFCLANSVNCGFASSSTAFVTGGNSFGAGAVLGTNDSNTLTLETNNTNAIVISTTGGVQFSQYGAGTLETDASGNITASSDARLKNVQGNFTRGLDAIRGLTPSTYTWNDASGLDQSRSYSGFIAQNVQTAIPEAISTDQRGYLTLSDRPILAASVNAIKELDQKVRQVESRLANLNQTNSQLSTPNNLTVSTITTTDALVKGQLTVRGAATFEGTVRITGDLRLDGKVLGNSLTRGKVTVQSGQTEVGYTFVKAYSSAPNVTLTATNTFAPRYRVEATRQGFTVYLEEAVTEPIVFNYQVQQ